MALKFTEENFETEVLNAQELVLVDFYADWCGPCKMMAPVVDKLAEQYEGIVKIGKLNVDEENKIAGNYHVMSIPTFILFKNGTAVKTVLGVVSEEELIQLINKNK